VSDADDYLDPKRLADKLAFVEGAVMGACMAVANMMDELGPSQREHFMQELSNNLERIEASTLGLATPAAEENIRGLHYVRDWLLGEEAPPPTWRSPAPPEG
jgi:hypothetical protein